jgi:hypothetical protein
MFTDSTAPNVKMPHLIELVGMARQLVHGPYLYLPCGRWVASFFIGVEDCRSPNSIRIDVLCNYSEELAMGRIDLTRDGTFRLDLTFEVTEPTLPMEARVALDRGSIDGKFELLRVEVWRLEAESSEQH